MYIYIYIVVIIKIFVFKCIGMYTFIFTFRFTYSFFRCTFTYICLQNAALPNECRYKGMGMASSLYHLRSVTFTTPHSHFTLTSASNTTIRPPSKQKWKQSGEVGARGRSALIMLRQHRKSWAKKLRRHAWLHALVGPKSDEVTTPLTSPRGEGLKIYFFFRRKGSENVKDIPPHEKHR